MSQPDHRPASEPRGRLQFRLATLFLLMILVAVLAAALGGLLRMGAATPRAPLEFFIAMMAGSPIAVMIAASLFWTGRHWLRRRARRSSEGDGRGT